MRFEPLGDQAWLLRDLPGPSWGVARAIEAAAIPAVVEAVPCFQTVAVHFLGPAPAVESLIEAALTAGESPASRTVILPVCYEIQLDLASVAEMLSLSVDEVIACHLAGNYDCEAIGFRPGFGYLTGLKPPLDRVTRHSTPRPWLDSGAVAIAAGQAGVYPQGGPGGWQVIGNCPLDLVDLDDGFFALSVGDRVRFVRVDRAEHERLKGERP